MQLKSLKFLLCAAFIGVAVAKTAENKEKKEVSQLRSRYSTSKNLVHVVQLSVQLNARG
jgi:hypothetical protein